MKKILPGYSFVEIIIVVLVLGIMTLVAVPRLKYTIVSGAAAEVMTNKIVTDLRRTRRLAISDGADNPNGYELKFKNPSPYSSYDIINSQTSAVIDSHEIENPLVCTGPVSFKFGPLGSLLTSDTQINIASEEKSMTITVIPATGMIKWSKD